MVKRPGILKRSRRSTPDGWLVSFRISTHTHSTRGNTTPELWEDIGTKNHAVSKLLVNEAEEDLLVDGLSKALSLKDFPADLVPFWMRRRSATFARAGACHWMIFQFHRKLDDGVDPGTQGTSKQSNS
ncbi:hypothetical protein ACRALDRAFT_2019403 [Sodiomyces alcalophilus JCM 7366]|uniref:uncharacterized protein n=1 Tax=Sodiomyces alcalophilus JCM 7366 TaxID=591952 RepID=UPI0039B695CA